MTNHGSVLVDDEERQLIVSERSGEVRVSILAPLDATTSDVRRASTRASEVVQNELAFRGMRDEADEGSETPLEEDERDESESDDNTKYGPQGVGETVLTDVVARTGSVGGEGRR